MLADQIGERLYLALYAAYSVLVLGWLIVAPGRAPYVALWDCHPWQTLFPNLLMLVVCLLAVFGIGIPNPFSPGDGGRVALIRNVRASSA
jgi:uncharacterized membrane protein